MSYDITSPTDPSFSSSSLTVHEELHCWVIESMLFIKSIFLAALALLSLFVFTSLPFHLSLLPFFFHYWLSWDLFSSALYHLPFFPVLSCLPLRLSGEPGWLFQCARTDNHSAAIFVSFSLLPSLVCIDVEGALRLCSWALFTPKPRVSACDGEPSGENRGSTWKLCNWLCVLSGVSLSGPNAFKATRAFTAEGVAMISERESTLWRYCIDQSFIITTQSFWGKLDGY